MIVYLICYMISFLFASNGYHFAAGIACLLAAAYLYYYDYSRSGNLIHLRGLFSLFWLGGQGLACFQLSHLQKEWSPVTWLCFFLALAGFWVSFEIADRKPKKTEGMKPSVIIHTDYLLHIMAGLTAVALAAFVLEAAILGFIPFFVRGVPHAYSEFHISGVHYFTVSSVLVPSLMILYFLLEKRKDKKKRITAVILAAVAIMIPILCVSRFQLIFSVVLGIFTYISVKSQLKIKYAVMILAAMIPLYLGLTVLRAHDVAYLNGIFEMKYEKMPIFITQPYIYIANNYDNFNCLVEQLPKHTYGLRMLFPLWALTGLKFLKPELVNFPLYINKEELTTLTMFYDSYYDFGVLGVLGFAVLLGLAACWLTRALGSVKNPISYLVYAQFAGYFVLSFFTTWFSNPTTWFYFAVTAIMWIYFYFKTRQNKQERRE